MSKKSKNSKTNTKTLRNTALPGSNESIIKLEVSKAKETERQFEVSNEITKDSSLAYHFATLSIVVLAFGIGFSFAIISLRKIFVEFLNLPNSLELSTLLSMLGFGLLVGAFYWRKQKQNSFKFAVIVLLFILLLNLTIYVFPGIFRIAAVTAFSSFDLNPNSLTSLPVVSIAFIGIYSILGGVFVSLMIPALSLVDIWHRERLRTKKLFVNLPPVRRGLSIWAPTVIILVFIGYIIVSYFTSKTDLQSFDDAKTGILISIFFIALTLISCLIYSFFKPKNSDIYAEDTQAMSNIGSKVFSMRTRYSAMFSSLFGIIGLTVLTTVFISQYNTILKYASYASFSMPELVFVVFIAGCILGIILLMLRMSTNTIFYLSLLLLILSYIGSVSAFQVIDNPQNDIFNSTKYFLYPLFILIGVTFMILIRSSRLFFEADVFNEGRILSKTLGLGLFIGSIVSALLIIGINSPFFVMQYGFNCFAVCIVLAVFIAPSGTWLAHKNILTHGLSYIDNDRRSFKPGLISILWMIVLTAIVVGWNYFEDLSQTEAIKFNNGHSIVKLSDDMDKITYSLNGKKATFDKSEENYSLVSALIGVNSTTEELSSAFVTNNLYFAKPESKGMIINPFMDCIADNEIESYSNPIIWILGKAEKYHYIHIDINAETASYIIDTGVVEALANISNNNPKILISFNIDINSVSIDLFINSINEINTNFKNSRSYYLPDMFVIFNRQPDKIQESPNVTFDFTKILYPQKFVNQLTELDFWEVKVNHLDPILSADIKSDKLSINSLIIDNFCEKDSLPYLSLKTLNALIINDLDEAKKFSLEVRNRYNELVFHEENLKIESKYPVKFVYNEVQYKTYYQSALEAMQKAAETQSPMIRKNLLNDAKIWGQKAGDLKPFDISAWIICYKSAKLLNSRDLALFEKKINELDPKLLNKLSKEDFADK